jgi:hypothetical protein
MTDNLFNVVAAVAATVGVNVIKLFVHRHLTNFATE